MSKNKKQVPTIRSSAAEYLSFIASSGEGGVEAIYASENIWLTQKMMGELYQVDVRTINYHLKKIFNDNELEEYSVIQDFRITASDGAELAKAHALSDFEKYRIVQDRLFESDFDKMMKKIEASKSKEGK